jgi:hypothetical protein
VEFGLLPEFSTPVQKPVENTAIPGLGTQSGLYLLHFCEAKVRKRRFEAILGAAGLDGGEFAGRR